MAWLADHFWRGLDLAAAGALWAFFALTLVHFTVEVLRYSPRMRGRLRTCLQFQLGTFFRVITALACTFRLTGLTGPRLVGTRELPWMSETIGFVVVYLACHFALLGVSFIVQELALTFRKRPYSIPRMWRDRMDKYVQVREPPARASDSDNGLPAEAPTPRGDDSFR